jgi:hypothetical protein
MRNATGVAKMPYCFDLTQWLRFRDDNVDRTPAENARNLEEAYWAGSLKSTFDVQRPSCCACATHS